MIFIDFSQLIISSILSNKNGDLNENLYRHISLNVIRNIRSKFQTYGDIVISIDSKKYWRKEYFPYYKNQRKKQRDSSGIDFQSIFSFMEKFKSELRDNFPYKVIEVLGAESDDVIGTLVPIYANHEDIIIISSDQDFLQLQKYSKKFKVKQHCPRKGKFITSKNPVLELKEKILTGDSGDGIPNVLSKDDIFLIEGQRQKSMTKNLLEKLLKEKYEDYDDSIKSGFIRNQKLIDFEYIPTELKEKIIEEFDGYKMIKSKNKILNYMIQNRLKNLIENVGDF